MNARGFTLIELMIAMVVMLFATAAATQLLVTGVSLNRNAENLTEDLDNARMAGGVVAHASEEAGLLTPGGIWVYAGSPTRVEPVWAANGGATASDQIYAVVPDNNALREACIDPGAAVPITAATASTLSINCPAAGFAAFTNGDQVLVTNMTTGALLTGSTSFSNTSISGGSNQASYSVTGAAAGYEAGDLAFRAQVWRYFIKATTIDCPGLNGVAAAKCPGLYRHRQVASSSAAAPFSDDGNFGDELVQPWIEDLQAVFIADAADTGNPSNYAALNGYGPAYTAGLRAVRLTVVAVSRRRDANTAGGDNRTQAPMKAEDHTTVGIADGYRRTMFVQRIELPNLAPGNI